MESFFARHYIQHLIDSVINKISVWDNFENWYKTLNHVAIITIDNLQSFKNRWYDVDDPRHGGKLDIGGREVAPDGEAAGGGLAPGAGEAGLARPEDGDQTGEDGLERGRVDQVGPVPHTGDHLADDHHQLAPGQGFPDTALKYIIFCGQMINVTQNFCNFKTWR